MLHRTTWLLTHVSSILHTILYNDDFLCRHYWTIGSTYHNVVTRCFSTQRISCHTWTTAALFTLSTKGHHVQSSQVSVWSKEWKQWNWVVCNSCMPANPQLENTLKAPACSPSIPLKQLHTKDAYMPNPVSTEDTATSRLSILLSDESIIESKNTSQ